MAITPIPYSAGFQVFGPSPRIQRFAVSLHKNVTIKDIALGNHTGLTGAPNTPSNYIYEGSIVNKASDGNWYMYGVTLPGGVNLTYLAGAAGSNPTLVLAVLIDSYDTNFNGTGNPVNAQAYFSGAFQYAWLRAVIAQITTIENQLRLNDILYEGGTQVTTQVFGDPLPRESAPV